MRFTPKSADELAEAALLPEGEYGFEVTDAEDATSKAGNEMVALTLKVFDADGGSRVVRDYLVASDGGMRKVRAFAAAAGLLAAYDRGDMEAADMIGRAGKAKFRVDKNEGYEPKNVVAWYLDPSKDRGSSAAPVTRRATAPVRQPAPAGDLDDEIPF